jgi:hypothetical protein
MLAPRILSVGAAARPGPVLLAAKKEGPEFLPGLRIDVACLDLEVHSTATNRNRLSPISTSFNSGGLAG